MLFPPLYCFLPCLPLPPVSSGGSFLPDPTTFLPQRAGRLFQVPQRGEALLPQLHQRVLLQTGRWVLRHLHLYWPQPTGLFHTGCQ